MLQMTFGKKTISTEKPAFIMGILNVTPDSFWKESRGGVEQALKLIEQGADILDIGGESTRPGFTEVPAEEEIARIVPVIKEIRKSSDVVISVDTRKASVLRAAVEAGADVLNDVSALEDDIDMADVAAELGVGVVLMHRFSGDEQSRVSSSDVVGEVSAYLEKQVEYAVNHGIDKNQIIVDPGIGFGKTFEENITLIKDTDKLCKGKYPVLMALSRKRCIGTMTDTVVEERLAGTLAANMISVQRGAKIVRVHDVKETNDVLNVMKYLQ